MLVSISTLVAREIQVCGCDVEPEPVGPEVTLRAKELASNWWIFDQRITFSTEELP